MHAYLNITDLVGSVDLGVHREPDCLSIRRRFRSLYYI